MMEFIAAVIAVSIRHAEAHPEHSHELVQIFRPVSVKTLTANTLQAAAEIIDEKITALSLSTVTVQTDAGTILRHYFLNFVASAVSFMLPGQVHPRGRRSARRWSCCR
jgi:hypothetical protein